MSPQKRHSKQSTRLCPSTADAKCRCVLRIFGGLIALFAIACAAATLQPTSTPAVGAESVLLTAGGVDSMLPGDYRNPRSAEAAVQWALSQVGVNRDSGFCLRFVDLAFGRGSGPASAHMVWTGSDPSLHHTSGIPPRGSVVVWSSAIGGGHGHIAISLGDGRMISTTSSQVSILSIAGFADSAYLGWMPPYFYV
jgi:hypothetical protein